DELPQLLLVPIGRMSLVGPRPEMPFLHDAMPAPFARLRTEVRPGCAGLWQIGHQCSGLIVEAPEYDLYYVDNWSPVMDLVILWRTARAVVLGAGAY
ncbi:MAG: sugar transferase, partial [Actinobacteria bacterium]|nr:sugar transferase [Actinomycetota bacterium]